MIDKLEGIERKGMNEGYEEDLKQKEIYLRVQLATRDRLEEIY